MSPLPKQANALAVYRDMRSLLVDELGIDPSKALQELEKAILRQDSALAPASVLDAGALLPPPHPPGLAIMALAGDANRVDDLITIAEPLPDSRAASSKADAGRSSYGAARDRAASRLMRR